MFKVKNPLTVNPYQSKTKNQLKALYYEVSERNLSINQIVDIIDNYINLSIKEINQLDKDEEIDEYKSQFKNDPFLAKLIKCIEQTENDPQDLNHISLLKLLKLATQKEHFEIPIRKTVLRILRVIVNLITYNVIILFRMSSLL